MGYGENCNMYCTAMYLKSTATQNIYSQTRWRETKVQRWEVTHSFSVSSSAITFCNKSPLSELLTYINSVTEKVWPNEVRKLNSSCPVHKSATELGAATSLTCVNLPDISPHSCWGLKLDLSWSLFSSSLLLCVSENVILLGSFASKRENKKLKYRLKNKIHLWTSEQNGNESCHKECLSFKLLIHHSSWTISKQLGLVWQVHSLEENGLRRVGVYISHLLSDWMCNKRQSKSESGH